ncbi:extensin [Iris pallida]|uniref:Extensin n=1 Tax=Iris pallida TaxID=29817 RepID=A0AAX6E1L9_IRIPA|nr:extensin [Iris pallida]
MRLPTEVRAALGRCGCRVRARGWLGRWRGMCFSSILGDGVCGGGDSCHGGVDVRWCREGQGRRTTVVISKVAVTIWFVICVIKWI